MPDKLLGRARLVAQGLVTQPYGSPGEAVAAHGAMQGQDLPGVVASAALRSGSEASAVTAAMDAGEIVRGYPMRGTVFLMPATDATWMGELCALPAMKAARARQHQLGLDDDRMARAREVAVAALAEAPNGLSRADLFALWEADGQPTKGGPGYHLLGRMVSETVLFYGPWNGKDQNVVLAETWVPAGTGLEDRFNGDRIAAAAEFLRRYLNSHGPATIRDFAWWTKLTLREARAALDLVVGEFEVGTEPEPTYWRPGLREEVRELGDAVASPVLLPGFDEFILGYQDRLFAMTEEEHQRLVPGNNGVFGRSVVVDGQVLGLWKRGGRPGKRTLEVVEFTPLSQPVRAALADQFERFPFTTP
ncbi:winged helix DNA-binding domain-containing protein [Tessaracoccus sp. OS52]|uniref:winged helix DNA-binding domain-containing protein n=1 Tax=Tessaracoccus sp. OS52 TaxID=2886691 RepID=UPI001D0FD93D|nr:winged helix DNA-binding domain-containing protein [Tessaracoccus sp. OS52]MCC2594408.1 winged helix DNA-binding domain-containing protein [Tessaracoccus sp. OS52]